MFWALLTTLLSLTTALHWTDSLTNNTVMTVCSASDIHLPWNFTLSPDERVEDIKWIYRAEDGSDVLIAVYVAGQITTTPAYHGRVQWTGQGGVVVGQAAVAESGNYTVVVSTADATHALVTFSKTVYVEVAYPPTAQSAKLHVLQELAAVVDNTTGQWTVQLTCGVVTSPGHPPVHVVWTSPDGHTVESSSEHNGTFRLLLPNPPSGGNYTCTLPPLSPATRCLPPLSPLLEGATVTVDEVKASFTLLEARQRAAEARLEAKQQEIRTQLEAKMNSENARLQLKLELLEKRLATAILRVSFHAMLPSDFNGNGTIKPFFVYTNEGNAFNRTSGIFTTPRNGTYFFAASAGTYSSELFVNMALQKDGVDVSRALTKMYLGYTSMGSVQATLYLTAGQRVWLFSHYSDTYYTNYCTSFTGFLIRADD